MVAVTYLVCAYPKPAGCRIALVWKIWSRIFLTPNPNYKPQRHCPQPSYTPSDLQNRTSSRLASMEHGRSEATPRGSEEKLEREGIGIAGAIRKMESKNPSCSNPNTVMVWSAYRPSHVIAVHTQFPQAQTQRLHSTWVSAPSS